jgi:hypothetical protein
MMEEDANARAEYARLIDRMEKARHQAQRKAAVEELGRQPRKNRFSRRPLVRNRSATSWVEPSEDIEELKSGMTPEELRMYEHELRSDVAREFKEHLEEINERRASRYQGGSRLRRKSRKRR